MTLGQWKRVLVRTWNDIDQNHTLSFAAGLSYYFILSLFPALITLATVVALLPIPNLFEEILTLMGRFVPPDSMGLVRTIVADVITPNKGALLSFGLLGALWTVSSGFAAMIEGLNIAYDVPETRPIWKTRLLSIALSFLIGSMFLVALVAMILGPQFGEWLSAKVGLSRAFAAAWPVVRWTIAIAFVVLAIVMLYFLAPNVKQRFRCSVYGAVVAVIAWLGLSYLLGLYLRNFADYNKTYGTLGAAVVLMVWLYWSGFAILIGAEINSEILQVTGDGRLPLKQAPPKTVTPKPATESDLAA
jgi:membrane protein